MQSLVLVITQAFRPFIWGGGRGGSLHSLDQRKAGLGDSVGNVCGLGWVKVRCKGLTGPVPGPLPWESTGAQRGGCQEEPVGPISREQFLV